MIQFALSRKISQKTPRSNFLMKINALIFLAIASLLFASLACNFGGFAPPTAPTEVSTPIPVSTQAVQSLELTAQAAAQQAQTSGKVTLTMDESQLTSLVALELQKQSNPEITEPQVLLRDGQVQLSGNVHHAGMTAPMQLNMTVSADAEGKPHYQVVSAKVGPLPLPDSLLGQLTSQIDSAFNEQIGPEADKIFIESISIADGKMTIVGHNR
jgi:uncharacterized protein YpmS